MTRPQKCKRGLRQGYPEPHQILLQKYDPTAEMQKGIKTSPKYIHPQPVFRNDPTAEMQKGIKTKMDFAFHEPHQR